MNDDEKLKLDIVAKPVTTLPMQHQCIAVGSTFDVFADEPRDHPGISIDQNRLQVSGWLLLMYKSGTEGVKGKRDSTERFEDGLSARFRNIFVV